MNDSGVVVAAGPHGATVVSLNTPHRRNSIRLATIESITTALDADPSASVVLRSQTNGMFCSGADLRIDDAERREVSDRLYGLYENIVTRPGVVVAVVDGPAVGGGAQLATAADLRIAGPNAAWKWAGPAHGLAVGAWVLPDLVGRGRALSLMLTQRWLPAAQAVEYGLADEVSESPDEAAGNVLKGLAALDRSAVARIKQISSMPELIVRLRAERDLNRQNFSGAVPARN
ncbi:enoyl-CoA hydratase/isomerase family protein [Mycolicibacterium parafortuitum]|uniref:Enoyl-CoA hydratase/isomerase [Rubrobacter xylanophilus DSM 9941] n=1 Tax=Mycolicibacterium parafortuitum TaxID=39692 RepID=A0A375YLV8_MYCPF|nr:enoyl-CoA hydratase/isomerase family protein [Mycolicibacterium parafortuitum]ORB30009.1 hypothetical protein BST38_12825 [Mycolicibacterium parafortuitum]SRX82092.1 enoyl-CoA hydratase/isomerase [Rubrobacter xylanophilus DSM 9941] [Mycolicibacterium parafortuitum]